MTWEEILWDATFGEQEEEDTSYNMAEEKEIERYYENKYK